MERSWLPLKPLRHSATLPELLELAWNFQKIQVPGEIVLIFQKYRYMKSKNAPEYPVGLTRVNHPHIYLFWKTYD